MNKITYYKVPITCDELVAKLWNYVRRICWTDTGLSDPPSLGTIRILCRDGIALDATITRYELSCMVREDITVMNVDAEAPLAYNAIKTMIEALLANYHIHASLDGIDGKDIYIEIFTDMLNHSEIYTEKDIDEICDYNALTPITGFDYENGIVVRPNGAQVVESYSHYE